MSKPTAILTADIELRAFTPTCRTDDHWKAQEKKIQWLYELRRKYNCPIFDAGDLFDKHYKVHPSHELLGWALNNLPSQFFTVPGNHDLPGKTMENFDNSAMAVLEKARKIITVDGFISLGKDMNPNPTFTEYVIYGFPWGIEIKQEKGIEKFKFAKIALVHTMVYKDFPPFPGCEGYNAQQLLDLLPDFDLIVSGHNHQSFTYRTEDNRILVNPGSLMRNDADQEDFKPRVFLWFANTNTVKPVYVPIETGVISREHIDVVKERENRMDSFIEKLGDQTVHGVNFHDNLERTVDSTDISQSVKDKVWNYYEQGA